jgi:hypothetical protein
VIHSDFRYPLRRLCQETSWLREEFIKAYLNVPGRQSQLACEMAVVRLQDAWSRFCRELIVISAIGKTVTIAGVPLRPCAGISTRSSVMPQLISKYKRRRYEPKWECAIDCIDAGQRLGISNIVTIAAALGAANSPAEHIRHVRNFYAHRKQETAGNALSTGCFYGNTYPSVFSLGSYIAGGETIIDSWMNGLIRVAAAACQ